MVATFVDPVMTDEQRRLTCFQGSLILSSPTPITEAYCAFTRDLIADAFEGADPERVQFDMPVERYAAILAELKPRFIHHPESKWFLREILRERGCDLDRTHFDVPRLRTSTSDDYLTTGIAYAWHPHRDTWYSAPMQQINYWMPVFPIVAENAMAFHPAYFATEVPNSSDSYNYYEWNAKHRSAASTNVKAETRPLPRATVDVDVSEPLVPVPAVGGLIQFSGQHMHSSVPNQTGRTRFSIDFRTIHVDDVIDGRAAPNVDARCTGSSIRDFLRASDFAPVPDEVVEHFADGTEDRGDLVYSKS
jgi:hypothetical protein